MEASQSIAVDSSGLSLKLDAYEGPLDLLLELIRKHEVDIFDIPIATITDEFLAFMHATEALDLSLGGEWLETAAMLVYIKSKLLLPKPKVEEDDEGPDPREELVQRLLEYQKYKAAAGALGERPQLSRDVFTHAPRSADFVDMLGPAPLKEASLDDLVRHKCTIEEIEEYAVREGLTPSDYAVPKATALHFFRDEYVLLVSPLVRASFERIVMTRSMGTRYTPSASLSTSYWPSSRAAELSTSLNSG